MTKVTNKSVEQQQEEMDKTILEKLEEKNKEILADPDGVGRILADDLAKKARAALFKGIESDEWVEYMKCFKPNKKQLDRLTGQDTNFNESEWGMQCLAYIASNATCTIDTAKGGGTRRNMTKDMENNLDAGIT